MNVNLPNAKETERQLIGAIFLNAELLHIAVQSLIPEMFYGSLNKSVYTAMHELNAEGRKVDFVTVYEMVKPEQEKRLGLAFKITELVQYTNNIINISAFDEWVNIIQDKYLKRQMVQEGLNLVNTAGADALPSPEILADHNGKLNALSTQTEKDLTITEMLIKVSTERDQRQPGVNPYPTGIGCVDHAFSVKPSDLVILAARPAQGKTAFALNWFKHLTVDKNVPSLFVSLEMSYVQLLERLEANLADVSHDRIGKNLLTDEERMKIATTHTEIARKPIYITDRPYTTTQQLRAKISLYIAKYGVKAVFIDYLQLIRCKGRDAYERISEVSVSLKGIAKEFNIPVIALAQLSREVEKRPNKMPQLSDLRDSGQIEQDADSVIFLMRPEYYDMPEIETKGQGVINSAGKMIVKLDKFRHGVGSWKGVVDFDGDKMRVGEMPF